MRRLLSASILLLSMAVPDRAEAFDYLEHLWFTDEACHRAQRMLGPTLADHPQRVPAYLGLALVCPARWEADYCVDGNKAVRGFVSLPDGPPAQSGDYAITLGDYSALADHVSRQGPIRNLPRAGEGGLVETTLRWLVSPPGGVGGPIGDVAEDACETGGRDDFRSVEADVALVDSWANAGIEVVPERSLAPLARGPLDQGPHDPPMKYSFDNPHYLDLVLRNHTHFGREAYGAWQGFHSAAVLARGQRCEQLIAVDADEAEDLADPLAGWDDVDWDDFDDATRDTKVCTMLGEQVRDRLLAWAKAADPELVHPVRDLIDSLASPAPADVLAQRELLNRSTVALISLVLEGTGIHYLQDGLAGGHMRTIRSREALIEVRHDHDRDNREGVVAVSKTHGPAHAFVAWGDGYLLGKPPRASCDPESGEPEMVTTCLVAHQRALLAGATRASLIDWALEGPIYAGLDCTQESYGFICALLPTRAAVVASEPVIEDTEVGRFHYGTLPVPPPPFSYEALSVIGGYGPGERSMSLGLRVAFLEELDRPAHWLTSYEGSMTIGLGDEDEQYVAMGFGYGFHYRLYARVMLDLVPWIYGGVRDFEGPVDFFAGAGPRIGFSVLPEGWVKIPVELSITAFQPFVLYDTSGGFLNEPLSRFARVELGLGLAYMH